MVHRSPAARAALPLLLLLLACGSVFHSRAADAPSPSGGVPTSPSSTPGKRPTPSPGSSTRSGSPKRPRKQLTRSDGHRWDRLSEIVKLEIKSSARKFLEQRDQVGVGGSMAWWEERGKGGMEGGEWHGVGKGGSMAWRKNAGKGAWSGVMACGRHAGDCMTSRGEGWHGGGK